MKKNLNYIIIAIFLLVESCTPTRNTQPTTTPEPTGTPLPTSPPIPTPTMETETMPKITALRTAKCLGGPGSSYDEVTTLIKGDHAEIVGREDTGKYWIIKNPKGKSGCWIDSQAVSTEGELGYLPYLVSPPTPTPALPAVPENVSAEVICEKTQGKNWKWNITIHLSWEDRAMDDIGYVIYKDGYEDAILLPSTTEYSYSFPSDHDIKGTITYHILVYNQIGSSRAEIQVDFACPNY